MDSDGIVWVSNDQLIFAALPAGEKPTALQLDHRVADITAIEWAKAWRGREATASVLESGIPASMEGRAAGQVVVVDVTTGKAQAIDTAPDFATLRLSPNRRFLAYLKQVGVWIPDSNLAPVRHVHQKIYRLAISEVGEGFRTRVMAGIGEVFRGSPVWSPASNELAVVGLPEGRAEGPGQVFRCRLSVGLCRPATNTELVLDSPWNQTKVPPILWRGAQELLILARAAGLGPQRAGLIERWWAVDEEGMSHAIANATNLAPASLRVEANESTLVGILDGDIWRLDGRGHLSSRLTSGFARMRTSIEWPRSPQTPAGAEVVIGVRDSSVNEFYVLSLRSGHAKRLRSPSADARLAAYDASTGTAAFASHGRDGTFMWVRRPVEEDRSPVLATNTFLGRLDEGSLRKFNYRGLDGQDLIGWMILPVGYQAGRRYPVVTWAYASHVYSDEPPDFPVTINDAHPLNLQLLAAHGYVVLLPSMPLSPYGEVGDPYRELPKGVLPALDKLVALGIADPHRLGVMGQSYGGYSTYGLITQTSRFRAAVVLAGLSNLVSLYGTFDARERYEAFAREDPFRLWSSENEWMGNPPWKDPSRYMRNSPISYVDRVQTPLLIIQGDLDYVPVQQGEEFFTGLYRQNKRARFVRYWGEDHILSSPANIRDMWQRIYAWFDEFLKTDPASTQGSQN
jgi:acetyl esterase/lipase